MSDLRDLYQEVILDHSKRPRNFRALAGAEPQAPRATTRSAATARPCYLERRRRRRSRTSSFEGIGLRDLDRVGLDDDREPQGQDAARRRDALFERFHELVTGTPGGGSGGPELGKLEVFSGVREFPVRVKCATLPWHTLKAALEGTGATISTESEGPAAEAEEPDMQMRKEATVDARGLGARDPERDADHAARRDDPSSSRSRSAAATRS